MLAREISWPHIDDKGGRADWQRKSPICKINVLRRQTQRMWDGVIINQSGTKYQNHLGRFFLQYLAPHGPANSEFLR